jgi:hypothetical protein
MPPSAYEVVGVVGDRLCRREHVQVKNGAIVIAYILEGGDVGLAHHGALPDNFCLELLIAPLLSSPQLAYL